MAEIEFTIPTVQFGNIKVRMTPEEMYSGEISPYDVGQKVTEWLVLAEVGRRDAEGIDFQPAHRSANPTVEAFKHIDEDQAKELIKSELGATEIGDTVTVAGIEFTKKSESPFPEHNEDAPPWEQPAPEKSEPWKSKGPVKKPAKIEW